jgi:hypothetical protein
MNAQEFHDFLKMESTDNLTERGKFIYNKFRPHFKDQINDAVDFVRDYY